jgi:prevent-host-death family protein
MYLQGRLEMRSVSAREANQQFSRILEAAENGETVVITKRGKPVAKLVRFEDSEVEAERRRQIDEMLAHLRKGALRGGRVVDWARDELYDRGSLG